MRSQQLSRGIILAMTKPQPDGPRSKHRVPRWMNVLWLVFVFGVTSSFVVVAIRRGCDFVQTLGFLAANFGLLFGLAVGAGGALYGISILLEGFEAHKAHS